jgi:hypothetical protein
VFPYLWSKNPSSSCPRPAQSDTSPLFSAIDQLSADQLRDVNAIKTRQTLPPPTLATQSLHLPHRLHIYFFLARHLKNCESRSDGIFVPLRQAVQARAPRLGMCEFWARFGSELSAVRRRFAAFSEPFETEAVGLRDIAPELKGWRCCIQCPELAGTAWECRLIGAWPLFTANHEAFSTSIRLSDTTQTQADTPQLPPSRLRAPCNQVVGPRKCSRCTCIRSRDAHALL